MNTVIADIIKHYDNFDEDSRLHSAYGMLEEEHTRRLILRNIPSESSIIYDIGGGTGAYSGWLAQLGYKIHFSDIVPKHVETFGNRDKDLPGILSIGIEDAMNLSYADNVADIVLFNGPLYHLLEPHHRLAALKEAGRILKPRGKLLAVTISRLAGLLYALSSAEIFNDNYYEMVIHEMRNGTRNNQNMKIKTFISAYFHSVEEIESEIKEAGLEVDHSAGIAGQSWNTPNLEEVIKDPFKKERLLAAAELMEGYPMLSPKIMTIAVKRN